MEKIAIIAGSGILPELLINELKDQKISFFVIGFSDINYKFLPNIFINFENIIDIPCILKKNNINKLVMCGGIKFNGLKSIKLNLKIIISVFKTWFAKSKGDDFLLNIAQKILENNGIHVIGVHELIPNLLGSYLDGIGHVSLFYDKDIKFGRNILKQLESFDIGQSIIIQDGRVIGIEAAEGTHELIVRCNTLKLKSANRKMILVKCAKKNQSRKMDLPTIGVETINALIHSDFAGLAIQQNSTIMLEKEKVKKICAENNIFLKIID